MVWLVAAILISVCTPTELDEQAATRLHEILDEEESELWLKLLTCAQSKNESCRQAVEAAATRPESPAQRLAAVILEEWDLANTDPRLQQPRSVWQQAPTTDEAKNLLPPVAEAVRVGVTGRVTSFGIFEDPEVVLESQYDALNQAVVSGLTRSLYRPAMGELSFEETTMTYVFRLEVGQ